MARRSDGSAAGNGSGARSGKGPNGKGAGNGTRARGVRRVPPKASRLPGRLAGGQPVTARGNLVIIGGHEEKQGRALILREVARRVGAGKLVVATVASEEPEAMWRDYQRAFTALGVRRLEHLDIADREALLRDPRPEVLEDASVVFFTG